MTRTAEAGSARTDRNTLSPPDESVEGSNANELASAVQRLAERLRAYSLSVPAGTFLGSQPDLLERFGVSRTTLKAATALLVQDNVIATRRGAGGGYFSANPTNTSVARHVATLLSTPVLEVRELTEASQPVRAEVARLAALRGGDEDRRRLGELLAQDQDQEDGDLVGFLVLERTYREVFLRMTKSRVLQLFATILTDLINLGEAGIDLFADRPEQIRSYRAQRMRVARAVIEGEAEVAHIHALRQSEMALQWLDEHERSGAATRFGDRLRKSLSRSDAT